MNIKTLACNDIQYKEVLAILDNGVSQPRLKRMLIEPSDTIATVLRIEASTGLRVGDILSLTLNDIMFDGDHYRFNKREQKTHKLRTFKLPDSVYEMIIDYVKKYDIEPNEKIFNISAHNIQMKLHKISDYLGYTRISTHSFRKRFATKVYKKSGNDLTLTCELMQHASPLITKRYIAVDEDKMDKILDSVAEV